MPTPIRVLPWLVLLWAAAGGCQPLPAGSLDAVTKGSHLGWHGSIYLVRGWRDLWSGGIDQLAGEIDQAGLDAAVYRESQWRGLCAAIERRYRSSVGGRPLVLVGFSYGADDVLRIAQRLQEDSIAVDLVITIDPVTPPTVPTNVRACYNYFQTNGVWDIFPWLRGVRLKASLAGQLMNVDIRRDRPDLLEPDTSHATIAANSKLHREIVKQVCRGELRICPP
jgi:pimeloyl-ACP methyl ester carboxylesterase